MSKADFPIDLRAVLEAKSMTGRELARACDIEEATISRYVNGLPPGPRNGAKIKEALGLVIDGPVAS
jgi:transcriptional regulator with XRE-family HTH domain